MFESILDKLISSVIAIGSLIFPFVSGTDAVFENVDFFIDENKMYFSGQLANCYTKEFDEILKSGQGVKLNFKIELFSEKGTEPKLKQNFYHKLRYNLIDKKFVLYISEKETSLQLRTINDVHLEFARIDRHQILNTSNLKEGKKYYVRITAYMDKITFYELSENFDLMLYWNNNQPVTESNLFDLSLFAL